MNDIIFYTQSEAKECAKITTHPGLCIWAYSATKNLEVPPFTEMNFDIFLRW